MPRENLSNNAINAMTAPETAEVLLNLLTIKYDDEPILRVVDDKQEITSNGESAHRHI